MTKYDDSEIKPALNRPVSEAAVGSLQTVRVGNEFDSHWCPDAPGAVVAHNRRGYGVNPNAVAYCTVVFRIKEDKLALGAGCYFLEDGRLYTTTVFQEERLGEDFGAVCAQYGTSEAEVRRAASLLEVANFSRGNSPGLIPTGVKL